MSERKVLNKYYPPEFDPSKIPKLRTPKNRTFSIRLMAPFNMRCNVCGEYIYKGKKFNSRKENVDNEDYLGLRIFRFYIRCPKCVAEIAFKTDLKTTDYTLEAGATRLFEAEKLAHEMAEKERKDKEEEEMNPMKVLENRTKASRSEMEQLDELEELREINARHALVDTDTLLEKQKLYEEHLIRLQQEEEDQIVKSIFGEKGQIVKRLEDSDTDEDEPVAKKPALLPGLKSTDILTDGMDSSVDAKQLSQKTETWKRSVGTLSSKTGLADLVKKKVADRQSKISTVIGNNREDKQGKTSDSASILPSVKSATPALLNNIAVNNSKISSSSSGVRSDIGGGSGLSLLGNYSDSNTSDSDSNTSDSDSNTSENDNNSSNSS